MIQCYSFHTYNSGSNLVQMSIRHIFLCIYFIMEKINKFHEALHRLHCIIGPTKKPVGEIENSRGQIEFMKTREYWETMKRVLCYYNTKHKYLLILHTFLLFWILECIHIRQSRDDTISYLIGCIRNSNYILLRTCFLNMVDDNVVPEKMMFIHLYIFNNQNIFKLNFQRVALP